MRAALLIAWKDLRASVRDRSAIAVAVVAPLLLAFILSSVLPDGEFSVTYGYVDEDGGRIARGFEEDVLSAVEEEFAKVRKLDSRDEAERLAEDSKIAAAFVIPEGFSDAVQSGGGGALEIIADPASDVGAPIARSIAEGFVRELDSLSLTVATISAASGQPPSDELIREIQASAGSVDPPVRMEESRSDSREFDDNTFFAAGMAVFFLFFTVQIGAAGLLRERREGTLTRLMVAPVSRTAILFGKGLYTFVLGILSMTVLVVVSSLLLGASFGDPLGVAAIVVAAVFAGMGVQLLVTAFSRTDEQAGAFGSIVAVTLGLLGGTFFPLSQAPGLISSLSYLTPHAWIMRGLGDLAGGSATLADVVPPLLALLAFGAVTMVIAVSMIRRRGVLA